MTLDPLPAGDDTITGESPGGLLSPNGESISSTPAEYAHQPTPLALQAQTLADDASALLAEVGAMRETADRLATRTRRNEWAVALTIIGLTADVILTVFLITSNSRISNSIHAQCSLYELLIPSWRGAPPPGNPVTPTQYRDAYISMQNTADMLNCGIKHVVPGT